MPGSSAKDGAAPHGRSAETDGAKQVDPAHLGALRDVRPKFKVCILASNCLHFQNGVAARNCVHRAVVKPHRRHVRKQLHVAVHQLRARVLFSGQGRTSGYIQRGKDR